MQTHLPEEQNSFVGRERELEELSRLVRVTRVLTLCGPGGIGKTRLALRLLASVAPGFRDGVWFVELGDVREPDLVMSRVAAVMGITEEPGRPLADTVAAALGPRRLLLALDTCEHLSDACARVSGHLLACSAGLRLVMTSRGPLGVTGEAVWPVAALSGPSAGAGQTGRDGAWQRAGPAVARRGA